MGAPRKQAVLKQVAANAQVFQCTKCGKKTETPKGVFPYVPKSSLYSYSKGYAHICYDCVDKMVEELIEEYQDKQSAYIVMCHYLDIFFDEEKYAELLKASPDMTFSLYSGRMNMGNVDRSFATNLESIILSGKFSKTEEEVEAAIEQKWRPEDQRNRNYVLMNAGYDPFKDPSYTQSDLKFLYNTAANYLNDDVVSDPHRIQSVIELVKTLLQQEKINQLISQEQNKSKPDPKRLKDLVDVKRDYNAVVSTIANENGISLKGSGKNQAGSNTLSGIMKKMVDTDYEPIKVNFIDAKTSESFKEIAAINAKAIFDELNFQSDEYASMVAEQSTIISDQQSEIDRLKEENRKLKIEIGGG